MSHQHRDYARKMRELGFRVTPQRQLILDAVCEGGGHTTPDEIYARVQARTSALNRTTVYRTLDFLREMRWVVAARIGDQTYYEIAGDAPHHHLVCLACGQVEQVSHDTVKAFFAHVERQHQFRVDMDHLALSGLCVKCRGETGPRGRSKAHARS